MKLNFLQFNSIQQLKYWQIINLILTNLFKQFCTELITGLMKDLVGLLNQWIFSTLIFQLLDYYQEAIT